MVKLGISIRLEAKPGKEQATAEFLKSALPLAIEEQGTINWYIIQYGPSTFGIFDTFETEEARHAHHTGPIAQALIANAAELLSSAPVIELIDILAVK
jgi:quinol monooxygenase YgiN